MNLKRKRNRNIGMITVFLMIAAGLFILSVAQGAASIARQGRGSVGGTAAHDDGSDHLEYSSSQNVDGYFCRDESGSRRSHITGNHA